MDTGAIYRSIALFAAEKTINIEEDQELIDLCKQAKISFCKDTNNIELNGISIEHKIRTPEIAMMASKISAKKIIRDFLFGVQKKMGEKKEVVFEGRDMGTVIFPNADFKFFLTANTKARAKRRFLDFQNSKSKNITLKQVEIEIKKRDANDANRNIAPLKPASDAIIIDSSFINKEEVLEKIYRLII